LEMEEYQQAQANRDKGAVDDMVVDYEFASASLARFRRSGWKDPCPSGAFMRPSTESCFPVNESQVPIFGLSPPDGRAGFHANFAGNPQPAL